MEIVKEEMYWILILNAKMNFRNNDCNLTYDDDYDMFSCVLKNKEGNTLACEGDATDMNEMIVGMEIIDFC